MKEKKGFLALTSERQNPLQKLPVILNSTRDEWPLSIEILLSHPLGTSEKNPLISLWDLSCHEMEIVTERTVRSWKERGMREQDTIIAVQNSDFSLNFGVFCKKRCWEGESPHKIVQKKNCTELTSMFLHWVLLIYWQKQERRTWPRDSNFNS